MTYTFHQLVRNTAIGSALLLSTTLATPITAFADTGYMSKMITVPHREVQIKLDIYFPAETGGETQLHGNNAVFTGFDIIKDAKPLAGNHPVVIFSHGSGGNGTNTGWIGKALADKGMIVIAPNHPGTTSGNSTPESTVKTWERPDDISSIIDQLPDLFADQMKADTDKIATVGFSLGGYTVLALAGAKVSKSAFIEHCDRNMNVALNECGWLTKDGLDLKDTDRTRFEQDNSDPRIKAFISVDPGLAATFTPESLRKVERPVMVINLGSEGTIYAGVDGKPIADKIPNAEYHQVENSWHFSFLGSCTDMGAKILIAEKDDPICDEYGGRDRDGIHAEIGRVTSEFLVKQFNPTN
jgi:predicted dienelactone hydrolase